MIELSEEALASLPTRHEPGHNGFVTTNVAALVRSPPAATSDLVEGVVALGEIAVLAAGRGIGKTWGAMQLAGDVASSGKWLGRFQCHSDGRPVLYSHLEMGPRPAFERWAMLGYDPKHLASIEEIYDQWSVRVATTTTTLRGELPTPDPIRISSWIALVDERLEQLLERLKPQLLIIDTWKAAFAGGENDNDGVSAALIELMKLAVKHNLAILIVHHFGKGADVTNRLDPIDAWRGASALGDRAHSRITVAPHYDTVAKAKAAAKREGIAPANSAKWAKRFADISFLRRTGIDVEPLSVRWDPTTGRWNMWDPPVEDGETEQSQRKREEEIEDVRHVMVCAQVTAGRPKGGFDSLNQACAALGFSKDKTRKLLNLAVRSGGLLEVPVGQALTYVLAPVQGSPFGRPA
jgi:RecA-family ATPase